MDTVPEGRKGIYIGKTSRSLHERSLEHVRDAMAFNPKSHIIKDLINVHPDRLEIPPFSFNTTCMFKDCLSRQIWETLKINYINWKRNERSRTKAMMDNCKIQGKGGEKHSGKRHH